MRKKQNIPDSTLEVFNIGKKYKNRPVLRNVSLNVKDKSYDLNIASYCFFEI